MAQDLLESKKLDGLTEAQVVDLLGPPNECTPDGIRVWFCGPTFMGVGFLLVMFDADHYVSRTWFDDD